MPPFERLLRGDAVSDAEFDSIYSQRLQDLSKLFWTPVEIAKRATEFLVPSAGRRVLDVGAGVGKFCLVGTCVSEGVFHGIEQRLDLVDVARSLATRLPGAIEFHHGNMVDLDWLEFESIYLYNPFYELTSGPWCKIDGSLKHRPDTQQRYVDTVLQKLDEARDGTRVATYFGFGGQLPDAFEPWVDERYPKSPLRFWTKNPPREPVLPESPTSCHSSKESTRLGP